MFGKDVFRPTRRLPGRARARGLLILVGLLIGCPLSQPANAQSIHRVTASEDSGSTFAWEGNVNGVNTAIGNKLTSIPIVGWTARGGMPVQLTLNHNSKSTHNSELGQKWTHSLDIYLIIVNDDFSTGATALVRRIGPVKLTAMILSHTSIVRLSRSGNGIDLL